MNAAVCIRSAHGSGDVEAIHALGLTIPELRVSADRDFMTVDEVCEAVERRDSVFYVAEKSPERVVGFVYAAIGDADRPNPRYACIVYLAVTPMYRGQGVATRLYEACTRTLRERGVTYVYAWADPSSGVVDFMAKKGFTAGKSCVWMDKEI